MSEKVKVRIAVAVDAKGVWNAAGHSGASDADLMLYASEHVDPGESRYWLEAELDVPEANTVKAEVSNA